MFLLLLESLTELITDCEGETVLCTEITYLLDDHASVSLEIH